MTDRAYVRENHTGRYASIYCPGCKSPHTLTVTPAGQNGWTFNENLQLPTFYPSLLVNQPGEHHYSGAPVCHSFITDGRIKYLADSTHALAGQEVDLPAYPRKWQ